MNGRNVRGQTPLIIAAANNPDPEVIVVLLGSSANAVSSDAGGRTAIDHPRNHPKLAGTEAFGLLEAASL